MGDAACYRAAVRPAHGRPLISAAIRAECPKRDRNWSREARGSRCDGGAPLAYLLPSLQGCRPSHLIGAPSVAADGARLSQGRGAPGDFPLCFGCRSHIPRSLAPTMHVSLESSRGVAVAGVPKSLGNGPAHVKTQECMHDACKGSKLLARAILAHQPKRLFGIRPHHHAITTRSSMRLFSN